jgi:hypothetical protein
LPREKLEAKENEKTKEKNERVKPLGKMEVQER